MEVLVIIPICKYAYINTEFQCHKLLEFPFQTLLVARLVLGTQLDVVHGGFWSKPLGTKWLISVNGGFSLANDPKLALCSQVADKKEIEN